MNECLRTYGTRRIFRIRRAREGDPNEGQEGHHGTDHPDRGRARFDEDGQPKAVFLDYPDGSAPAGFPTSRLDLL